MYVMRGSPCYIYVHFFTVRYLPFQELGSTFGVTKRCLQRRLPGNSPSISIPIGFPIGTSVQSRAYVSYNTLPTVLTQYRLVLVESYLSMSHSIIGVLQPSPLVWIESGNVMLWPHTGVIMILDIVVMSAMKYMMRRVNWWMLSVALSLQSLEPILEGIGCS